jgi:membrane protein DedA with SNARE-associated domain
MAALLHQFSYVGIILVLVLTGMGLPIPEEAVVIFAGIAASHGQLDPWTALAACLLGAILGDSVTYWLGFHFGRRFLREHPLWARFLHAEREEKLERQIQRHGMKTLFAARFLVGVRAPMYLSAGILHVPYRRFLVVDVISALSVIGLTFGLSYFFGEQITTWIRRGQYGVTAAVAAGVIALGIWFWLRRRRSKLDRPPVEREDPTPAQAAPPPHRLPNTEETVI